MIYTKNKKITKSQGKSIIQFKRDEANRNQKQDLSRKRNKPILLELKLISSESPSKGQQPSTTLNITSSKRIQDRTHIELDQQTKTCWQSTTPRQHAIEHKLHSPLPSKPENP